MCEPEFFQEGPQTIWADSFEDLAHIAIKNLRKQGKAKMVCGPMTTGGTGDQRYNFEIFNAVIKGFRAQGVNIFDQLPYELGLHRLMKKWEAEGNSGYCWPILKIFYQMVFESGYVAGGLFIPKWETSTGAKYEHQALLSLKIDVVHINYIQIRQFLLREFSEENVQKIMTRALLPPCP